MDIIEANDNETPWADDKNGNRCSKTWAAAERLQGCIEVLDPTIFND